MFGRILFKYRWSISGRLSHVVLSLASLLKYLQCLGLIHVLCLLVSLMKSGLLFLLLLDPLSGESLESRSAKRGGLALLLLLSLLLSNLIGLDLSLQQLDLLVLSGKELLLVGEIDPVRVDAIAVGFW